jgi:probable HAF family extracellular repeat protein
MLLLVAPAVAGLVLSMSLRHERLYTVTVLPMLGGKATLPCAINDYGQIAGFAETPDGQDHIFLWDRVSGMKDLGPTDESGLDINNAGQIAGTTQASNGYMVAFLWDPMTAGRCLVLWVAKRASHGT